MQLFHGIGKEKVTVHRTADMGGSGIEWDWYTWGEIAKEPIKQLKIGEENRLVMLLWKMVSISINIMSL